MFLLGNSARDGMISGMEEVVVQSPDNVIMHRAFACALLQHRDSACSSRGKFIEAQLKLEEPGCPDDVRRKLTSRQRKLLKDHGRAWLGELAEFLLDRPGYRFEMKRGWLAVVEAPEFCPNFAAALTRAPQARLLERLVFHAAGPAAALEGLLGSSAGERLRFVQIGDVVYDGKPAEQIRRLLVAA